MNPNLLALVAYAGKYQPTLLGQLYKELALAAEGIRVIPGVKNKLIMPRLRIGKGLKPYTGTFASAPDQLKYSDRTLEVARAQRDLSIDPEKYRTSYLSFLDTSVASAGSNANKERQIPFAQFMWQEFMKENAEEIVEALYFGEGVDAFAAFNAGSTYAVGNLVKFAISVGGVTEMNYWKCTAITTAGQSPTTHPAKWQNVNHLAIFKGYKSIIASAIATEGFDQIASTGALTVADAYDQFTEVYRLQIEQVKKGKTVIMCSQNSYETLLDSIEENSTKNYELINGIAYLPKTNNNCMIKPVSWLAGSNRLICTPANNLVVGTDQLSDMNQLTNIPQHYHLETSLSFLMGTQIADLDVLTINDQV